jgi:putative hydrolase of the HAD superfamily
MKNGRHLSFDLWNTLISPNPAYTEARTKYLGDISRNDDLGMVAKDYTSLKRRLDRRAEMQGEAVSTPDVFKLLACQIFPTESDLVRASAPKIIMEAFKAMFRAHPPIVLPETISMLKNLSAQGYTLSIGSNTNFISGETLMDDLISKWGIDWKYTLFSDQELASKPSKDFFDEVLIQSGVPAVHVTHIGDNVICDGGANKFGMNSFLIMDPKQLVTHIESLIYLHKKQDEQ